MRDVFEVLGQDHAEVKDLLTALEESPGLSEGAAYVVLAARGQAAERLIIDSSAHEAAEERYFWPAVRQQVPEGDKLADEAIGQESDAKEVLSKLDKLAPIDPEFDELIAELTPAARQHIEFEETQVWPQLRAALTPDQAAELGAQVTRAKERSPEGASKVNQQRLRPF